MRKLAVFCGMFSAAVFAANYLLPLPALFPAGALLAALAAVVFVLLRNCPRRALAVLAMAGVCAGFWWTAAYDRLFFSPVKALDEQTVYLRAVVTEWPQETDYGYSVEVRVDVGLFPGTCALLYVDGQGADLRPGDEIGSVTRCTLADRTFSGEPITYYTAKGIFLRGETFGKLDITRPERPGMLHWPAMLSRQLSQSIEHSVPTEASGLIQALVTGKREGLEEEFVSALERTGLSHTVAVSGMHMAFLTGLFSLLLGRGKRSTAAMTVLGCGLFCMMVGNTPSVIRAAIMICMLQLAPLLGRERDDPTALFFALAVLLAANPYSAAHVGLQLSFAAVAGLQLAAQPIQSGILRCFRLDRPARLAPLRWLLALPRGGVGVLSATLAASVFTVPLVAVHFQSFVLIAPLANLLALWAVSVLFTGGLCTGVLGIFAPGAASAAGDVLAVLARYFYWVVEEMAGIPFAAVRLDSVYHALWLGYLCVLVGAALIVPGRKRPWIPVGLGSAGLALAVFLSGLAFQSGVMTTAVLDVGQGQSVLLQSGEYLVLVDCGGDRSENAGDIAADYIQSLGHTQLDLLVVSHYHADHANGIGRLLKRMDVTALALPDVEQDDPLRREILQLAQEREVPVHFIREDTLFSGGGEENFTVYAPMTDGEDTNEIGLTVLASAGEFDVLITGDMGEQTELELLSSKELPDLEILVVGHHGSRYSTSRQLLAALKPETAVISVGGSNTYGHPAQETLERLERAGCGVYRTDKQGTVVIRIDE